MIKLFKNKKSKRVKPNRVSVSLSYNEKGNYTFIELNGNKGQQKVSRFYLLMGNNMDLVTSFFGSIDDWLCDMISDEVVKND